MKSKILILLLALVSVSAFGQQTKLQDLEIQERIRVVGRSDSTTISNVGQIQFDADDDKFRFNDGTGWFSFLRDDATLPYLPITVSSSINVDVDLEQLLSFGDDSETILYVFPSATTPFAGMVAGENKLQMDGQGIHIETDTSLL